MMAQLVALSGWAALVALALVVLDAPTWAVVLGVLIALHGYSNQLQILLARREAARR